MKELIEELIELIRKELNGKRINGKRKEENGKNKKGAIVILGGYTDQNEKILRNLMNYLKEIYPDKLIIWINYLDKIIESCQKSGKNLFEGRNLPIIIKRTIELLNELDIDWDQSTIICWSFGIIAWIASVGYAIKTKQQYKWITPGGGCLFITFPWGEGSLKLNDQERKALEAGDSGLNKLNSKKFYQDLTKILKEILSKKINMVFLLPWYDEVTKSFNDGRLKIPITAIIDLLKELLKCYSGDSLLVFTKIKYPGHLASIGYAKTEKENYQAKENLKQIAALLRKMLGSKVTVAPSMNQKEDNFNIFLNL